MSRDGTRRGGPRPGAGRKPRDRDEMALEGRIEALGVELPSVALSGRDMPDVHEHLKRAQEDGGQFQAEQVFEETWRWLAARGAEESVGRQLVEQYAMTVARWIQCEDAVSKYGFIAKHPTTGAPIASPYVAMGREYLRQANQSWWQIWQIVKEMGGQGSGEDRADPMEAILSQG